MSVIVQRIEKNRMMLSSIVNTYFLADQNQKLLAHLLDNHNLLARWKGYAASGVDSLRFSLYMYVLSEMRAILFDNQKKVTSIHNIINCLKDTDFKNQLKKWFCDSSGKKIIASQEDLIEILRLHDAERKAQAFDELLDKAMTNFQMLLVSEVGCRVNCARNKMISHKEFTSTVDGERRVFDASDFGLVYTDAKDIIEKSHDIIFPLYSIFTKSHFNIKHTMNHHNLVANEFWSR